MSIIKLICSLLKKPSIESSTLPDDWPPDDSMHFLDITKSSQKYWRTFHFPERFKVYEFSSNGEEDDPTVIPLAYEIMERLCESRTVLTEIKSIPEILKKRKYSRDERFTVRYHRFLKRMHPQVSVYAENEQKLGILTTGFNAEAFWAYREMDTIDDCCFDFYLFPEKATPLTAQQAWTMVRNNEYSIRFWLNNAPNGLDVVFDTSAVDIASVQAVIKGVCEKHHVFLFNPPEKD